MTSMRENNCEENDLPPAKETKNKTNRTEQIKIKTNRREPWEEPPLDKQDRLASPVPPVLALACKKESWWSSGQ